MAFGFLKQMLKSPDLSLLPLALRFGSSGLGCLLGRVLSKLFYLLGGNLGRLLCCLLRRHLSRIHFRLIERKRKAKEVHVSIERRAHQPLERLLLIRNQIPEGCVGSPVYHCFSP